MPANMNKIVISRPHGYSLSTNLHFSFFSLNKSMGQYVIINWVTHTQQIWVVGWDNLILICRQIPADTEHLLEHLSDTERKYRWCDHEVLNLIFKISRQSKVCFTPMQKMYLLSTMHHFTLRYGEWQSFHYHPNDLYLMGRPQIYHELRLRPSKIRHTQVVLMHSFIKIWKFQFTPSIIGAWAQRLNPRPGGGLGHLRPGGGGQKWTHLTQNWEG